MRTYCMNWHTIFRYRTEAEDRLRERGKKNQQINQIYIQTRSP